VVEIWAALFRNGQIIPGTSRTAVTPPMSNNTLTLTQDTSPWTQAPTLSTLQPGDTIVVTTRAGSGPVVVWGSDSITLSDIKIYGSPDWALSLYETSNSTVDHVSVMPRPGTGLVGSNADGIHFNSVFQNNHIRNSYVTRTMDDALAMDSQVHATVVSVSGPRQLTVSQKARIRSFSQRFGGQFCRIHFHDGVRWSGHRVARPAVFGISWKWRTSRPDIWQRPSITHRRLWNGFRAGFDARPELHNRR
jgi:hypothetical protein